MKDRKKLTKHYHFKPKTIYDLRFLIYDLRFTKDYWWKVAAYRKTFSTVIQKDYFFYFSAMKCQPLISVCFFGYRAASTGAIDDGSCGMFYRGFTGYLRQPLGLLFSANQLRMPIPLRNDCGKHLDEFGLIMMLSEAKSRSFAFAGNGRLYDPVLARFLSPDPYLQAPDNLQNHNRYSYALNNPLRYTDPSGEWIHLAIGAFIGGVVNWATHGAQFNAAGLGYFGVGALAGGLAAGIGAGIGGLVSGAGSFSFSVPSSLAQLGFLPGAAVGGAAGITNGLISGTGNSLVSGTNIGGSLARGLESAWKQGLTGAAFGGISAGIDAVAHGRNFLTGHAKGSMYVSAERLSINVPEQRAELNTGGMSAELDDLNTHIIDVARTTETNQSTISSFSIDEGQLEGYFLEPAGPSSAVEGSGLRIQEGIYEIGSYSSTKFDNHFELLNVPGRSQILIHGGTGPLNTSGCLVIGNNVGLNSISGWQEMMGQLRTYINSNGGTRNFYIIIQ